MTPESSRLCLKTLVGPGLLSVRNNISCFIRLQPPTPSWSAQLSAAIHSPKLRESAFIFKVNPSYFQVSSKATDCHLPEGSQLTVFLSGRMQTISCSFNSVQWYSVRAKRQEFAISLDIIRFSNSNLIKISLHEIYLNNNLVKLSLIHWTLCLWEKLKMARRASIEKS